MIILVSRGSYEIIEKKPFILRSEPLGAGIAIGFINREKELFGLLSYLFPYREADIELDEGTIYSGESLLNLLQSELEKEKVDFERTSWILIGASCFKRESYILDLTEKNLKVAESWFKRNNLWERVIKRVKEPHPLFLEVNAKESIFEVKIQNKVERYE
ncbi:MAG: hypothetical protein ACP5KO_03800 [Caldimicrobium sp.]